MKISYLGSGMAKSLCVCAALSGTFLAQSEVIEQWDVSRDHIAGVRSNKNFSVAKSTEKTPDGDPVIEVKLLNEPKPDAVPWTIQINFASKQNIAKGDRFRYSFSIKADREGKLSSAFIQNVSPWKSLGNFGRSISVTPEWRTVVGEGNAVIDHNGPVSIMFCIGKLPQGMRLQISSIKLEKL